MEMLLELSWAGWFSLGLVTLCFILFAASRVAPDVVTSGALTLLLVSGVLTPAEALAGFANPGMLTVGVLYVVVSGLTETGAVGWIGPGLLGRPRGPRSARLRLMLPVASLSAFLNNTPVVAIFIPAVQDWARRHRLELSRLLIPLSYASIAGGTCTLIGTSTNLVVNGLYVEALGGTGLGLFEPLWVGLPVTLTVGLFLLLAGDRLLPHRQPALETYEPLREYVAEMLVEPDSPLIGRSIEAAGLRQLPGLFLIEIERGGQVLAAVSPQQTLMAADRLVFVGILDSVMELQRTRGLIPATDQVFKLDVPRPGRCFVEAVLSDKSPLVGLTVREGRFRNRYDAVIIALSRHGERVAGKIGDQRLLPGDTLLLETQADFVEQQRNARDFLLVSQIGDSHPLEHRRAPLAVVIVVAMVALAASGLLSMLEAALLAAGAMILTRCTRSRVARRAPDWQVLVVIATSFGIGAALEKTGAASLLAGGLIGLADGAPWATLALVFVATAILTSLATNNVAAVLVFPVALEAARSMGVAPEPLVLTVMVAASASFATPIGYQTNLMVFNVGGYRFGDFVRVGVPLTLLVGLVTVLVAPLVWPF
ncbi:MAG: SLC13 family permease [Chromatiaceae bacterium]|nr:SLC13 family permease [Chromatiaceae bacterium]